MHNALCVLRRCNTCLLRCYARSSAWTTVLIMHKPDWAPSKPFALSAVSMQSQPCMVWISRGHCTSPHPPMHLFPRRDNVSVNALATRTCGGRTACCAHPQGAFINPTSLVWETRGQYHTEGLMEVDPASLQNRYAMCVSKSAGATCREMRMVRWSLFPVPTSRKKKKKKRKASTSPNSNPGPPKPYNRNTLKP